MNRLAKVFLTVLIVLSALPFLALKVDGFFRQRTATVYLQVIDAKDKRPVAGARIELSGVGVERTTTNKYGRCNFAYLQPGSYAVRITKPGHIPLVDSLKVEANTGHSCTFELQLIPVKKPIRPFVDTPRHFADYGVNRVQAIFWQSRAPNGPGFL